MTRLLLLLFALVAMAQEITIASYNVENLFDLEYRGDEYSLYKPYNEGWDIKSYQTKLRNIASVIAQIDADIIVLQEIESERALKDLLRVRAIKKCGYKEALFGRLEEAPSNTSVALLSKLPVLFSQKHPVRLSTGKWSRPILEAKIKVDDSDLTIFGVHLPSKRAKESARVEAAKRLHSILDTLEPETQYLVCGDFNSDHDEAVNLLTAYMDDSKGISGINHILKTTSSKVGEEFRLASKEEVRRGEALLYEPWQEREELEQYSYLYRGELSTLDHILLSKNLVDNKSLTYKDRSFQQVINTFGQVNGISPYRWQVRWGKTIDKHKDRGYSDHLPVQLTLTTDVQKTSQQVINIGSFENSSEGWLTVTSKVHLLRKRGVSLDGSWALHLEGKTTKNESVARIRAITKDNIPSLYIGGKGIIGIRAQSSRDKKWFYLKEDGGVSKRSSYFPLNGERWEKFVFTNSHFVEGDTLTLEIRCKKDEVVDCYVDVCSLRGWVR